MNRITTVIWLLALATIDVSASVLTSNEPLITDPIITSSGDLSQRYSATCTAHGTLSPTQIHNEVMNNLEETATSGNPQLPNGPLKIIDYPGGGGEVSQEQDSPPGDDIWPLLIMAVIYAIGTAIHRMRHRPDHKH